LKFIKPIFAVSLLVLVLSVGLVSALEQHEASVTKFMAGDTKERGEETSIRILFTSNADINLSVYYVGVHFDWLETDELIGINYANNPKIVQPNKDLVVDIINYTVPTSANLGTHSYYVGVDGYDQNGDPFSWTSEEAAITVINPTSTSQPSAIPTPTATNPQTLDTAFIIYGALIAVAAVVVILVAVLKKRGTNNASKQSVNPSESPKPEEKPDKGQDFSI
jgi:hypothetical protein